MKLLLTNDDGIGAPGLEALHQAAGRPGDPLVVAPAEPQSGCSHQVTTDRPVKVEARGSQRFAVFGTPADCVRVGLHRLATETVWVLSGINHGGNLGADVHYSGTVAAVREAVLHGWPGVALSCFQRRGRELDWTRVVCWVVPVLHDLLARPWERGTFWNVNLPSLLPGDSDPEVVFCPLDPSPLPLNYVHEGEGYAYAGDYFTRQRVVGADVDVCFGGRIAVTQIRLL